MPTFPGNFGVVALHPALLEADAFLFLEQNSGNSALLDAYLRLQDGSTVPLYTLTDTKTVLNGSGAPTSGIGSSGDFYIDTYSYYLYGPKTGDSVNWPIGYSLQGPSGAPGTTEAVTGEAGPAGTGVPAGGASGQVMVKTSENDYETSWLYPQSLLNYSKIYNINDYKPLLANVLVSSPTTSTSLGSSVTYSPITNSLYIADNSVPAIYEFVLDGSRQVRKITLSGFTDVEAIEWMYGTTFALAEEGNPAIVNEISVVTIPEKGSITITKNGSKWIKTIATGVSSVSNKGIEGLAYNPFLDIFYFITEYGVAGVWNVWKINNQAGATAEQLFNLNTSLSGVATDISDLHFNRATYTLFSTTDEGATAGVDPAIIEFDLNGNIINTRSLATEFSSSSSQVEGICFSFDNSMVFITSEGSVPLIYAYHLHTNANPSVNKHNGYLNFFNEYICNKVVSRYRESNVSMPYTGTWSITDGLHYSLSTFGAGSGCFVNGSKFKMIAWGSVSTSTGITLSGNLEWGSINDGTFTGYSPIVINSSESNAPWKYEINMDISNTGNVPPYQISQFWDVYGSSHYSAASIENGNIQNTGDYFTPYLNIDCVDGDGTFIINSMSFYKV